MSRDIVDRIIRIFGTQVALASALGTTQSTISAWRRRGVIPGDRLQKILDAARIKGLPLTPADFFDRAA